MLVLGRYLLDRLTLPKAQAARVRDLRRRLGAQPGPRAAGDQQVRLAQELCRMRETLSAAFGSPEACAGCARPPRADWPGGDCCKADCDRLFTDDELAALRLSGTTPARLRAVEPSREGCPFCGRSGCSLDAADRPNVCVRYTCRAVEDELRRRGDLRAIAAMKTQLGRAFDRFVALRAAR